MSGNLSGHQSKSPTSKPAFSLSQPGILQRTCACGGVAGLTGECEECSSKRLSGQRNINPPTLTNNPPNEEPTDHIQRSPLGGYNLGNLAIQPKERFGMQTKLAIGQLGDQYEQEVDRVTTQVITRINEPTFLQSQELVASPISLPSRVQGSGGLIPPSEELLQPREKQGGRLWDLEKSFLPIQRKVPEMPSRLGLPHSLKTGIENLSGYSLDDVKVHYNSTKPAELQAHAYAQGTDIHLAPGQEKHLPHEAWHVVQQKQRRVKPTMQVKGVAINDDQALEREAELIGNNHLHNVDDVEKHNGVKAFAPKMGGTIAPIQRVLTNTMFKGKSNREIMQQLEAHGYEHVYPKGNAVGLLENYMNDPKPYQFDLDELAIALKMNLSQKARPIKEALNQLVQSLREGEVMNEEEIDALKLLTFYGYESPNASVFENKGVAFESIKATQKFQTWKNKLDKLDEKEELSFVVDRIRGKDNKYQEHQGSIYLPYVEKSRELFNKLITDMGDAEALFSLERGGSLLADMITGMRRQGGQEERPNIKVYKQKGRQHTKDEQEGRLGQEINKYYDRRSIEHEAKQYRGAIEGQESDARNYLMSAYKDSTQFVEEEYNWCCNYFKEQIKNEIPIKPPEITIAVSETLVGGGSTNRLLGFLKKYIEKNSDKSIKFKVLLEQHTVRNNSVSVEGQYEGGEGKNQKQFLTKPTKDEEAVNLKPLDVGVESSGKVVVYIRNAPYILGEDVNYQLKYEGSDIMRPIIIFGGDEVRAVAIHPRQNMTAREILIDLVMGVYDEAIKKYF